MKPDEWNTTFANWSPVRWREAYPVVAREVLDYLTRVLNPGDLIGTNTLVEALYPARFAKGDGILARQRIYKALVALALPGHALEGCCTKGVEKKQGRFKGSRPALWHAPRPKPVKVDTHKVCCPRCAEEFEIICGEIVLDV